MKGKQTLNHFKIGPYVSMQGCSMPCRNISDRNWGAVGGCCHKRMKRGSISKESLGVMGCGGGQLEELELERGLYSFKFLGHLVGLKEAEPDRLSCMFQVSGLQDRLSRLHSVKDKHMRTWALRMRLGWEATGRNAVWREG